MDINKKLIKFPYNHIRPYECKYFKWSFWNHYGSKMWEFGCKLNGGTLGSCNGICKKFEKR